MGHFQYECPKKEKEFKLNFTEAEEEMLLMAYIEFKESKHHDTWYLDSGCSNHMCGNRGLFFEIDESFREQVKLGNDTSLAMKWKGNIKIQMNDNMQTITRVFYVPELKIGQLQEKGLTILIQKK